MACILPLELDLSHHCTFAVESPPRLSLTVALHQLARASPDGAFSSSVSLLLPGAQTHVFGVLASEWDGAVLQWFARQWPALSKQAVRTRTRPLGFSTLAVRALYLMKRHEHLFGHVSSLSRLFPHVAAETGGKRISSHATSALADGDLKYLRGECLLPLHLVFFFWWLAHQWHEVPAEQILFERSRLETLRVSLMHRVGLGDQLANPNLVSLMPPNLVAVNAAQVKLDHLLVALVSWQHLDRLRAQVETQTSLDTLTRVVQQLTKHVAAPIDTADLDALVPVLGSPPAETLSRTKKRKREAATEDDETSSAKRVAAESPLTSSSTSNDEIVDWAEILAQQPL